MITQYKGRKIKVTKVKRDGFAVDADPRVAYEAHMYADGDPRKKARLAQLEYVDGDPR